ncbi:MAG: zinc-binding dehydrogenase, partial [Acidobacteria bacterium]|nr:zinc-binding dehydrogenase [Acidobacteriota bacterium]
TVCVMGAGPIGVLTASVARIAGASRVFIADKLPHRLALARELGVDCAVNVTEASLLEAVMDQTHGRGVDIVFDAAAAPETINGSMAVARLGGQVVLIGIPSQTHPVVDLHTAMAKEINLQTVKRSNHNAHGAIELLQAGRITDRMVTHRYPLEGTPEAFRTLHAYADGVGKSVIEIP